MDLQVSPSLGFQDGFASFHFNGYINRKRIRQWCFEASVKEKSNQTYTNRSSLREKNLGIVESDQTTCGDMALSFKGCGVGESEVRGMGEEEGSGFGLVRCTRGLGRKSVGISEGPRRPYGAPLKRQCNAWLLLLDGSEKSGLEALPQDVLTVVAKQWHFAYTMPTKICASRSSTDSQNPSAWEEIEAPNAPLRAFRSRTSQKKLADVTMVLFASPDEGQWTRRGGLFIGN